MNNALVLADKTRNALSLVRENFEKVPDLQLSFEKEVGFAVQIVSSSDYLSGLASNNPDSLRMALYNAALTGLSLNPTLRQGYILPRKGKIIFEPSYMGLVKVLTDSGSVLSVFAEAVYEGDEFQVQLGTNQQIRHVPSGQGEGEIVAAYAVARLHNGEQQFEVIWKKQLESIKRRSEAFKAGKGSPWDTDQGEMSRKTAIRRLYKYLPKTTVSQATLDALRVFDENNPIDLEENPHEDKRNRIFSSNVVEQPALAPPSTANAKKNDVAVVYDDAADEIDETNATIQMWKDAIADVQSSDKFNKLYKEIIEMPSHIKDALKAPLFKRAKELSLTYKEDLKQFVKPEIVSDVFAPSNMPKAAVAPNKTKYVKPKSYEF